MATASHPIPSKSGQLSRALLALNLAALVLPAIAQPPALNESFIAPSCECSFSRYGKYFAWQHIWHECHSCDHQADDDYFGSPLDYSSHDGDFSVDSLSNRILIPNGWTFSSPGFEAQPMRLDCGCTNELDPICLTYVYNEDYDDIHDHNDGLMELYNRFTVFNKCVADLLMAEHAQFYSDFGPTLQATEGACFGTEPVYYRDCLCPALFQPVCAESNTFQSPCEAMCMGHTTYTAGVCPEDASENEEFQACPDTAVPVCADGVTYQNRCYAENDSLREGEIQDGECKPFDCSGMPPVCSRNGTVTNECAAVCMGNIYDFYIGECDPSKDYDKEYDRFWGSAHAPAGVYGIEQR